MTWVLPLVVLVLVTQRHIRPCFCLSGHPEPATTQQETDLIAWLLDQGSEVGLRQQPPVELFTACRAPIGSLPASLYQTATHCKFTSGECGSQEEQQWLTWPVHLKGGGAGWGPRACAPISGGGTGRSGRHRAGGWVRSRVHYKMRKGAIARRLQLGRNVWEAA